MIPCFHVSDLHGHGDRYGKLLHAVRAEAPKAVFLGGDLLPHGRLPRDEDFVRGFLFREFARLRDDLGDRYPRVFLILGNDDPRAEEAGFLAGERDGLWTYAHKRRSELDGHPVYGYAFVPPTPFLLKDWERYDTSGNVPPGCVSPEEGTITVPVPANELRYTTIREDLRATVGTGPLDDAVLLFHSPPYDTVLDRAALDGKSIDHIPLDVHVGSVAVRRFIEEAQPRVTLHGHVHESVRLSGAWRQTLGRTHLLGAAHDGPELALVRFDPDRPEEATRTLL